MERFAALESALVSREKDYREAIDRLEKLATPETEDEICALKWTFREAVEVVRCTRRLTQGRTLSEIHAAFGAPGDFGYDSLIGDALARTYRVLP